MPSQSNIRWQKGTAAGKRPPTLQFPMAPTGPP